MTNQAVEPREERVLLLLPAGAGDEPQATLIRLALAEAGIPVEPCPGLDALAAAVADERQRDLQHRVDEIGLVQRAQAR